MAAPAPPANGIEVRKDGGFTGAPFRKVCATCHTSRKTVRYCRIVMGHTGADWSEKRPAEESQAAQQAQAAAQQAQAAAMQRARDAGGSVREAAERNARSLDGAGLLEQAKQAAEQAKQALEAAKQETTAAKEQLRQLQQDFAWSVPGYFLLFCVLRVPRP